MKDKKSAYIFISSLIVIFLLYIVDQIFQLNYISKALIKVIIFFVFPIIFIKMSHYNYIKGSLNVLKKSFRFKLSHLLGILIAVAMFIAYILVKNYISTDVLVLELVDKYMINKGKIIFYGFYLTTVEI